MYPKLKARLTDKLSGELQRLSAQRRAAVREVQSLLGVLEDMGLPVDNAEIVHLKQECCRLLRSLLHLESEAAAASEEARVAIFDTEAMSGQLLEFAAPETRASAQ